MLWKDKTKEQEILQVKESRVSVASQNENEDKMKTNLPLMKMYE